MEFKNFNERNLNDEVAAAIKTALRTLEESAKDVVVDLTAKQRQKFGSVNEDNKKFINKAKAIYENKPDLFKGKETELGLDTFSEDHKRREDLEDVIIDIESLKLGLRSAKILFDKSNLDTAYAIYKYITLMLELNIPGYEKYYLELAQFFTKSKNSDDEDKEDTDDPKPDDDKD